MGSLHATFGQGSHATVHLSTTSPHHTSPADWALMVDGMQCLTLSSRLVIPILYAVASERVGTNLGR